MALKAAVDIGSNTVLLLIGEVSNSNVHSLYEAQRAPRLGKGVDEEKNLADDSINKVIDALLEFKRILKKKFPDVANVVVTATSAVRDAANRHYFLERVLRETGFKVQVLSGREEAQYTFFGAKSVLENISGALCVLDIGGGSTEVAVGSKHILSDRYSYNAGSVRYTERYLKSDPPSDKQLSSCRLAINDIFKEKIFHFPPTLSLIGVAGTVTSVAHLNASLNVYSPKKINGTVLPIEIITQWVQKLKECSSHQLLEAYPNILEGRADVILGGLLILECFMKSADIPNLIVSTGGIRHGAILINK